MNKLWKRALSVTMAVSLCAGGVPAWSQGETTVKAVTKQEKNNKLAGKVAKTKERTTKNQKYKEGEVVVMYRNGSSTLKSFSNTNASGITIKGTCDFSSTVDTKGKMSTQSVKAKKNDFSVALVTSDIYSTNELMSMLKKEKNVLHVEPNYIVKATGAADYSDYLWALDNKGQNGGTEGVDLNVDAVKDVQNQASDEKVIAIIDTGVNYEHSDLKDVMWKNPYASELKGTYGYDFCNLDADPIDDNGHGSHCAGIIAGNGTDGSGIKGIADKNTKIMALKFLDSFGYGDTFDAINAYNYIYKAQQLGVNVVAVNNSWGGYLDYSYGDDILEKIINLVGENGAVSVCAAGNSATDNDEELQSPACLDSDYIISVAASQEDGEITEFSCYGDESVDVAAPGANILSSVVEDTFNPSIYEDKDALCSYYKDFGETFVEQEKVKEVSTVSGSSFAYHAYADGDGQVSVTADKENFFGKKEDGASSLNWTIKDATEGEVYYLTIPYKVGKSDTEIYHSYMFQGHSPESEDTDWDVSFMEIYDMELTEDFNPKKAVASDGYMSWIADVAAYGDENYWTQLTYEAAKKYRKDQDRALVFALYINKDGDYTLNFDDMAVSKENVKSEEFGKYAFYNGTSMAAPYVTGTVALAKAMYPNESALETASRVKGSVKHTDSLKDKVASQGTIDLGKLKAPNTTVSGASIGENNVVTVEGAFFKEDTKVKVNGTEVSLMSKDANKITFQGKTNEKLNVEITSGETSVTKEFFFAAGEEIEKRGVAWNNWTSGTVISDGDRLYNVYEDGMVETYEVADNYSYSLLNAAGLGEDLSLPLLTNAGSYGCLDATVIFPTEIETLGNYYVSMSATPVCYGKNIYAIACLDAGFTQSNALVVFDATYNTWIKVADVPKEFNGLYNATLAAYKDKLYLIGGYDEEKNTASKNVYSFDCKTGSWDKNPTSMPGEKYMAKAVEAGGKLVVVLGANNKGASGETYVFDGTNWTAGATLEGILDSNEYYSYMQYSEDMEVTDDIVVDHYWGEAYRILRSYEAAVVGTEDKVVFTGLRVDKLGNTFTYDVANNKYATTNTKLTTATKSDVVKGGVIKDKFYILSGEEYSYSYDDYYEEDYFKNGFSIVKRNSTEGNVQEESDNKYGYYTMDGLLYISTMEVTNETIEVEQEKELTKGYVHGVGNYSIGDTITLTAVPYDGFFVKNLYVNGKKVKNGYTVEATEKVDGMEVTATFGKYVTSIEMPTELVLEPGKSEKLEAKVYPEKADNTEIIWSSSNEDVVKVTQKGKVTAQKDAEGKIALIKVAAKDRGEVLAVCEVRVEKAIDVEKIEIKAKKTTVKAGKTLQLTAKVKPNDATDKEVTWSTSKKKYATVSKNGLVKAKKAGKGKTVTITATSKSNKKVKATIKIKIK